MEMVMGRLVDEVSHSTIVQERLEPLTAGRSCTVKMNVYVADDNATRISGASLQEVGKLVEKSTGYSLRTWSVDSQ